jgi:hypothetical protein
MRALLITVLFLWGVIANSQSLGLGIGVEFPKGTPAVTTTPIDGDTVIMRFEVPEAGCLIEFATISSLGVINQTGSYAYNVSLDYPPCATAYDDSIILVYTSGFNPMTPGWALSTVPSVYITEVSANNCQFLFFLSAEDGVLITLDASDCPKLYYLFCNENVLTSVDVSGCGELGELYCETNLLTALDVSDNVSLGVIYCHANNLSESALTTIINALPDWSGGDAAAEYTWPQNLTYPQTLTVGQQAALTTKNWSYWAP